MFIYVLAKIAGVCTAWTEFTSHPTGPRKSNKMACEILGLKNFIAGIPLTAITFQQGNLTGEFLTAEQV